MKDGTALGIRMERLVQASQALDAASHWSAQAELVDACNAETPFEERPSLEQVAALLHADVVLSIQRFFCSSPRSFVHPYLLFKNG